MAISRVWVDRSALAIGLVALVIGVLAPVVVTVDTGVHLAVSDGRIVVWYVDAHSPAEGYGVQSGMVATEVNGRQLIALPTYVDAPAPASADPDTGAMPQVLEPPAVTVVPMSEDDLQAIADQRVTDLRVFLQSDLANYAVDRPPFGTVVMDDGRSSLHDSMLSVVFGIVVLFAMAWWLTTGRAGRSLRDLGVPLAVATAVPFLLRPMDAIWAPGATVLQAILVPASLVPLAAVLVARIENQQDRTIAIAAAATCALGAALVVLGPLLATPVDGSPAWLLAGAITAIPGILAAGPLLPGTPRVTAPGAEATASGRVLQSAELAIAGTTPMAALATTTYPYVLPFALWVIAIAIAGRFTVRPLARLASRAQLQRDLVVAATEAERARVAADIHDDALQELTLLVRRLDAAGDKEGADIARTVSDRLRAICGDLRLPILDDLGVGPALDWLVLRIERLAGGEVRLERADGSRPPADVELAFFRVAQEALANAVKHGRPPIVVRYRSSDGAASLSIDDAGGGIPADAGERAERDGHFGLLNMQQRAEGIGAILDVRRWPAGGTHVQLEWRAR
jgi:signal transduction histidine kinase